VGAVAAVVPVVPVAYEDVVAITTIELERALARRGPEHQYHARYASGIGKWDVDV